MNHLSREATLLEVDQTYNQILYLEKIAFTRWHIPISVMENENYFDVVRTLSAKDPEKLAQGTPIKAMTGAHF